MRSRILCTRFPFNIYARYTEISIGVEPIFPGLQPGTWPFRQEILKSGKKSVCFFYADTPCASNHFVAAAGFEPAFSLELGDMSPRWDQTPVDTAI